MDAGVGRPELDLGSCLSLNGSLSIARLYPSHPILFGVLTVPT